jgi:hypothetical protein
VANSAGAGERTFGAGGEPAVGKSQAQVYGEDGWYAYGGHVSSDGRHVLFTGNVEEDGDPQHAGVKRAKPRTPKSGNSVDVTSTSLCRQTIAGALAESVQRLARLV